MSTSAAPGVLCTGLAQKKNKKVGRELALQRCTEGDAAVHLQRLWPALVLVAAFTVLHTLMRGKDNDNILSIIYSNVSATTGLNAKIKELTKEI